MSVGGPSALGTLLVQRLDAALGVTLSQQTNIASGARPDAVSRADGPSGLNSAQNETLRHPQEAVDQIATRTEQQDSVAKSPLDAGQLDAALLDSATTTASTPSAPTTLGFSAKTILALLSLYPEQAPAIAGKAPLVDPENAGPATPGAGRSAAPDASLTVQNSQETSGVSARAFVRALSQALQESGLFYESHLNDLSFGQRTAASLSFEPQAQLAHAGAAVEHGQTQVQPAPAGLSAVQASQLVSLHPDTHQLVRQQLEVFANQALTWSGQAWPNASMQWEIERHESPSNAPDGHDDHWATRLNLALPHLGSVQARLSLIGQQLVMRLVAPQAADQLSGESAELRTRLLNSGLLLSHLSVVAAEPSDSPAAPDAAS
ncbi:MAG: flagellar hook-length control protein FliK [Candidimonas sp.]|nr:MAG: flagellar hook-length control protein FliK [Candidimonas sp.]TAM27101.1 MAG: flagellar hook-length control protein FliK [Candidimonas sp.]